MVLNRPKGNGEKIDTLTSYLYQSKTIRPTRPIARFKHIPSSIHHCKEYGKHSNSLKEEKNTKADLERRHMQTYHQTNILYFSNS